MRRRVEDTLRTKRKSRVSSGERSPLRGVGETWLRERIKMSREVTTILKIMLKYTLSNYR